MVYNTYAVELNIIVNSLHGFSLEMYTTLGSISNYHAQVFQPAKRFYFKTYDKKKEKKKLVRIYCTLVAFWLLNGGRGTVDFC